MLLNNQHYDRSEELCTRIDRIISRDLFIAGYYLFGEKAVALWLSDYLQEHFNIQEEFGENYLDEVLLAVKKLITKTYLTKTEAKNFANKVALGMLELVETKKEYKPLAWRKE